MGTKTREGAVTNGSPIYLVKIQIPATIFSKKKLPH